MLAVCNDDWMGYRDRLDWGRSAMRLAIAIASFARHTLQTHAILRRGSNASAHTATLAIDGMLFMEKHRNEKYERIIDYVRLINAFNVPQRNVIRMHNSRLKTMLSPTLQACKQTMEITRRLHCARVRERIELQRAGNEKAVPSALALSSSLAV